MIPLYASPPTARLTLRSLATCNNICTPVSASPRGLFWQQIKAFSSRDLARHLFDQRKRSGKDTKEKGTPKRVDGEGPAVSSRPNTTQSQPQYTEDSTTVNINPRRAMEEVKTGQSYQKPLTIRGTTRAKDINGCAEERLARCNGLPSVRSQEIEVVETVEDVRKLRKAVAQTGQEIGLVPTMGALHEGHLDLMREAARECEEVFVSIYVNPTQFGVNEDLSSYPRTFDEDMEKLRRLNRELQSQDIYRGVITTLFNPSTNVMYPVGLESGSHISMNPSLTQVLEGSSRPSFFQGVSTVVTKLLNIIQPEKVYFGQKDIQQLIVVQRMINEFHLPTNLRCIATRRHDDGLAMSSRNMYLGERRRNVAPFLHRVLSGASQRFENGKLSREEILGVAEAETAAILAAQMDLPPQSRAKFRVDYLSLADPIHLREVDVIDPAVGAILSGAVFMLPLERPQSNEALGLGFDSGTVRLIDNILLGKANRIGRSDA